MRLKVSTAARLLAAALFALPLTACDEAPTTGDEADLTAKGTRIASSLEGPGNLQIVNGTLVFSTAHFDASGDPELDQEFASWRGALWQKPLSGGSKKKVADTVGAVISTAVSGKSLLVVDSTYFGVTRFTVPGDKESDFYNDFSHFPDEGEEAPTLGAVAVGASGVYVTRPGSEVMRMKADGSDVKTFAKTWKSGWVERAQEIVVAGDAVFWSSEQEGEQGSTFNLYRASASGGAPKKLATFKNRVRSLASDGDVVAIAIEAGHGLKGEVEVVAADGKSQPRALVKDASPDHLRFDDRFGLLYADWNTGVVRVSREALDAGGAVEPAVVVEIDAPTSFVLSDKDLYVSSDPGEINEKKGAIFRYSLSKLGL